jgi:hypothetical protein
MTPIKRSLLPKSRPILACGVAALFSAAAFEATTQAQTAWQLPATQPGNGSGSRGGDYDGVVVAVAPEPGTFLALIGGCGILLGLQRIRRRR